MQLRLFSASVLQCAGNTKTPDILNSLLCLLDVIFNYFMIFPTHNIFLLHIPGAGLGVTGAAFGTAFSEIIIAIAMFLKAFNQLNLHSRNWNIGCGNNTYWLSAWGSPERSCA